MQELLPIHSVLEALDLALKQSHVRWYLFGAQAVAVWGKPRTTADVDITVQVPSGEVAEMVDVLQNEGFELLVKTEVDSFIAQTRILPLVHVETGRSVDVVLAGPGLEERFFERSVSVPFGDIEIPVISPEDLIVTKVLAGRPRDVEDVQGVLIERGEALDTDLIRSTLRDLEEALGQKRPHPALRGGENARDGLIRSIASVWSSL